MPFVTIPLQQLPSLRAFSFVLRYQGSFHRARAEPLRAPHASAAAPFTHRESALKDLNWGRRDTHEIKAQESSSWGKAGGAGLYLGFP